MTQERDSSREAREGELYRLLVENVEDYAIFVLDLEGKVESWNPGAERLLGYSADEVLGRKADLFFTAEDIHAGVPEHELRQAKEEGRANDDRWHLRKDGSRFWAGGTMTPLFEKDGTLRGYAKIMRDRTDWKRAQDQEHQLECRTSAILESITDAFYSVDRDWRFVYVNRKAEEFLGRNRHDLIGKNLWEEYSAGLGTEFDREFHKAMGENTSVTFGAYYPPHDRWYEVHAYPSPDGLSVYFREATERHQAAEAVRQSESQMRLLADTIPQLAWMAWADGHIFWYNRRWHEYTGTTPEQMEGWGWQSVHDPEELPKVLDRWKASIATGEPFDMVFPLRGADGRYRPFLTRVNPLLGPDGRILNWFGTNTDIGEIKEMEAALRASEQSFRHLADAMPQIVYTARADGRVDYFNRRWYEFTGLTGAEDGGDTWLSAVHPEDRDACLSEWNRAWGDGYLFEMELRFRDSNTGQYRWHLARSVPGKDATGKVVRWYGTSTDIHEQKRAADASRFLAQASAALATLVDFESTLQTIANLAVPYFADWSAVDVANDDGTLRRLAVAHLDPAKIELAQELMRRYPPDPDAVGGTLHVLRTNRPEIVTELTDEMLVRGARNEEHLRFLRTLELRSYICVPLVVSGKSIGVLTFATAESGRTYTSTDLTLATDLSHRASIAIENARLYRSLQDADRKKDEFLAVLAHELRNPLAPLSNALQILRLTAISGQGARVRDMMERQVRQLTRLVDDLLDVSRITSGKIVLQMERLDLAEVVLIALETSRPLIESARHELTITWPPEPLFVQGDKTRLAQVLSNLLTNSAKYTPEGGHIWLTVERHAREALIRVRDDGMGIPVAMLPKIFEMFIQVDGNQGRSQGGLGIGLMLVRSLMGMHGGAVEAHSRGPGHGSEFIIHLPLESEGASPGIVGSEPGHAPSAARTIARRRILVVDDSLDSAESLATMLRLQGNEVIMANDGPKALAVAETFVPDVVLLDIGMPGMDGYEVARRLRRMPSLRNAVLIAQTGWGQDEDRRRSNQAGFDHHLVKPVDPAALEAILGALDPPSRIPR